MSENNGFEFEVVAMPKQKARSKYDSAIRTLMDNPTSAVRVNISVQNLYGLRSILRRRAPEKKLVSRKDGAGCIVWLEPIERTVVEVGE